MKEQQPEEMTEPKDSPESETAAPDATEAPLSRAERRHGAAANQPDTRPVRGNRGGFAGPFQQGGPAHKRTHSHRKTG